MNRIDIITEDAEPGVPVPRIDEYCALVLEKLGVDGWDFSLMFCGDEYIARLNENYRGKEGPTDILTFCSEEDAGQEFFGVPGEPEDNKYVGDIAVSVDSTRKNCEEFGVSYEEELKRLIIHGILHLYGMDHATNDPDEKMLLYQEEILAGFGDFVF